MKLSIATSLLLLPSLEYTTAQQVGTFESEVKPTITLKECTIAGGCTSRAAELTLDANWRWIHSTSGYENCYTGNKWDSQRCSDPVECAKNCALEGVSKQKYRDTYGIQQVQDGVKMQFVTNHEHGTNVGSRLYVMDTNDKYQLFKLKNREFSFVVDVSELECGMNGAMYFSEMDPDGDEAVTLDAFRSWWHQKKDPPVVEFKVFEEWFWRRLQTEKEQDEARIRHAFERIDVDRSGNLDKQEVAALSRELGEKLSTAFSTKKLDQAFTEMDPVRFTQLYIACAVDSQAIRTGFRDY